MDSLGVGSRTLSPEIVPASAVRGRRDVQNYAREPRNQEKTPDRRETADQTFISDDAVPNTQSRRRCDSPQYHVT
jgi:hypothetical protein